MSSPEQMDRLIAALAKHTLAMQAQTKAITALAKSNEAIVDAMAATDDEDDDDHSCVDMAGNKIKVT